MKERMSADSCTTEKSRQAGTRITRERRGEDRERFEQDVIVTNLGEEKTTFPGNLTDCSAYGLGLRLPVRLTKGTTLAVEWGDTMVLGEIVYSRQKSSQYRIGLRTDYIILDRTISRTDKIR